MKNLKEEIEQILFDNCEDSDGFENENGKVEIFAESLNITVCTTEIYELIQDLLKMTDSKLKETFTDV